MRSIRYCSFPLSRLLLIQNMYSSAPLITFPCAAADIFYSFKNLIITAIGPQPQLCFLFLKRTFCVKKMTEHDKSCESGHTRTTRSPAGERARIHSVTTTLWQRMFTFWCYWRTSCQLCWIVLFTEDGWPAAVSYTHLDVYKRQSINPVFLYGCRR